MNNFRERVKGVFYLLIRDHIPSGQLTKVVNELSMLKPETVAELNFSNQHMESFADDLIRRLEDEE